MALSLDAHSIGKVLKRRFGSRRIGSATGKLESRDCKQVRFRLGAWPPAAAAPSESGREVKRRIGFTGIHAPMAEAGHDPRNTSEWGRQVNLDKVATSSYFIVVRAVGIKVLNSRLSEFVRLAASGETVLVTDRDHVVAEIGPPKETRSPVLADAMLADAVRHGWLSPPALPLAGIPPAPPPVMPMRDLLSELAEDRKDR